MKTILCLGLFLFIGCAHRAHARDVPAHPRSTGIYACPDGPVSCRSYRTQALACEALMCPTDRCQRSEGETPSVFCREEAASADAGTDAAVPWPQPVATVSCTAPFPDALQGTYYVYRPGHLLCDHYATAREACHAIACGLSECYSNVLLNEVTCRPYRPTETRVIVVPAEPAH